MTYDLAAGITDQLLFVNGDIHTMNPAYPRATAMRCAGGIIVAVGETSELRGHDDTAIVDLHGRTLLPGLIDGHCHLELTTTHLKYAVKCFAPPHHSIAEICQTLREHATRSVGSGWIVGRADFGLHQYVTEGRPITPR